MWYTQFYNFLYYEPEQTASDKVIIWVHGGGWNAGTPKYFDFVGQCVANAGYHFVSIGYRLSPKNKYPCQIEDVCNGYKAAIQCLNERNIDTSKVIVSGSSAGAHLSSILCYSKSVQPLCQAPVQRAANRKPTGSKSHSGRKRDRLLPYAVGYASLLKERDPHVPEIWILRDKKL